VVNGFKVADGRHPCDGLRRHLQVRSRHRAELRHARHYQPHQGHRHSVSTGAPWTNGSATDSTALIGTGRYGVDLGNSGTVTNFGTIAGTAAGVELASDSNLVNGSAGDSMETISGTVIGVDADGADATISNYGTIVSTAGSGSKYVPYGVYLKSGHAGQRQQDHADGADPGLCRRVGCVVRQHRRQLRYHRRRRRRFEGDQPARPTDRLKLEGGLHDHRHRGGFRW